MKYLLSITLILTLASSSLSYPSPVHHQNAHYEDQEKISSPLLAPADQSSSLPGDQYADLLVRSVPDDSLRSGNWQPVPHDGGGGWSESSDGKDDVGDDDGDHSDMENSRKRGNLIRRDNTDGNHWHGQRQIDHDQNGWDQNGSNKVHSDQTGSKQNDLSQNFGNQSGYSLDNDWDKKIGNDRNGGKSSDDSTIATTSSCTKSSASTAPASDANAAFPNKWANSLPTTQPLGNQKQTAQEPFAFSTSSPSFKTAAATTVASAPKIQSPAANPTISAKPFNFFPTPNSSTLLNPSGKSSGINTAFTTTPTTNTAIIPPAPTPSPSPAPSSSPSPQSSNRKRGLSYNASSPPLTPFTNTNNQKTLTWTYDWTSTPSRPLPPGLEFVPMLWGRDDKYTKNWEQNVQDFLKEEGGKGRKEVELLGFNEPDLKSQSSMKVEEAIVAYKKFMMPFASTNNNNKDAAVQIRLGAPAISHLNRTNEDTGEVEGLHWLQTFLDAAVKDGGVKIDFVPVHWYGCRNKKCSLEEDVNGFKEFITACINAVHTKLGSKVPIWVTEFAVFKDGVKFMDQVLPWLDGNGDVERYAWFGAWKGSLLNDEGSGLGEEGVRYLQG